MGVRGQASVIMKLTSGEPPFSSMEPVPYSRKNLRQPMTHARLRLATHIKGLVIEVVPGCPLEPECAERFQELWVASLETARDSHSRR